MSNKRTADVTISLYWDTRWKRWTGTVNGTGHAEWKRIDTTSEVGQAEAWLLLAAVEREMLSWLPTEHA